MCTRAYDEQVLLPDSATEEEIVAMRDGSTRAVREDPKSVMRRCNRAFLLLVTGRRKEALGEADMVPGQDAAAPTRTL